MNTEINRSSLAGRNRVSETRVLHEYEGSGQETRFLSEAARKRRK